MNMKNLKYLTLLLIGSLILGLVACDPEEEIIPKDDTPYTLSYGDLPEPTLPADNPLTVQGVQLGKMLFYETMLSKDGTQSCASCHRQLDGFSDTTTFSIGVEGLPGKRQAMSIFNMAWHTNEFFWDGRAHLLRDQSLMPIQDPLEMNETLENVITKLSNEKEYRDQFSRAFGSPDITSEKMSLAMEQFMLSIVSYFNPIPICETDCSCIVFRGSSGIRESMPRLNSALIDSTTSSMAFISYLLVCVCR